MLEQSKLRRLAEPRTLSADEEVGELNVVPFLDVIINILIFVLATLAVTFTATIDISSPKLTSLHGAGPGNELTVIVVNDGFALKASGGNVATGCNGVGRGIAVPKRDGAYDFAALTQCAMKLEETLPPASDASQIYVTANPGVDYKTIVGVIDAVRVTPSGEPLFPDVSLRVPR
jgi:biopolymer transport protein TolR